MFIASNIKKSNWEKQVKTKEHGIACGDIVVEEGEKKQCWKCKGHKAQGIGNA